jgi:hypothetical protein
MKQEKPTTTKTSITGIVVLIGAPVLIMFSSKLLFPYSDHSIAFEKALIISRILLWLLTLFMYLYAVKIEKHPFLVYTSEKKSIGFMFYLY